MAFILSFLFRKHKYDSFYWEVSYLSSNLIPNLNWIGRIHKAPLNSRWETWCIPRLLGVIEQNRTNNGDRINKCQWETKKKERKKQNKKAKPTKSRCCRHSIQWFMPQSAKKEVPPRPFLACSLLFPEVVDPSWPSNLVAHSYFAFFLSCVRICCSCALWSLLCWWALRMGRNIFSGYWGCSFFSGRGRVFCVDWGLFESVVTHDWGGAQQTAEQQGSPS